jgi:SAM-dependent methyltransferase
MKDYYSRRAEEYEEIYNRDDQVRKKELGIIKNEMSTLFKGRNVLEAACGTGYFTEVLSESAASVIAFDFSPEVIEIAKSKNLKAEFLTDDAYEMKNITGKFNGGCANFFFSHIPKSKVTGFLDLFHSKLLPGSVIFMADNVFVEGVGGELITKPGEADSYKRRTLNDGSTYEILKNYYSEEELRNIFGGYSENVEIIMGKCFWQAEWRL